MVFGKLIELSDRSQSQYLALKFSFVFNASAWVKCCIAQFNKIAKAGVLVSRITLEFAVINGFYSTRVVVI